MVSYESTLKILLLGDPEVDKSAIIRMYGYQSRTPNERLTIGVDFFVKTLVIDDKRYKLQLWDIGGAERFRFLLPTYCFGANAVVFLYDVSRFQTLDNIGEWVDIVRDKSGDIPIMLVGILPDDEYIREVSTEEGVKIAKSRNLNGFIECNLKTGKNIEKVFEDLTRLILADNSKGRKKRELKNAIRSQFLEKVSNKGDMDRLLDGFQIPEEVKKEKQPRLSDEDIKSLDLESEEGVKLIKQFQEETKRTALWKVKETNDFTKWLKGEKVEKRDQTVIELISIYLEDIEIVLKSWETKYEIDNLLHSLARFMLVYDRDYRLEFENFIERIKKRLDYDGNKYPYSEILKIVYGDDEYRQQFLPKRRRNFKDRERYPYPYVFKPPEPPDDLALAPRAQLRHPPKKKDTEEKINCQYCGLELTKEEQFTHSCQKKPKNS